jgi:hypothetical protein
MVCATALYRSLQGLRVRESDRVRKRKRERERKKTSKSRGDYATIIRD